MAQFHRLCMLAVGTLLLMPRGSYASEAPQYTDKMVTGNSNSATDRVMGFHNLPRRIDWWSPSCVSQWNCSFALTKSVTITGLNSPHVAYGDINGRVFSVSDLAAGTPVVQPGVLPYLATNPLLAEIWSCSGVECHLRSLSERRGSNQIKSRIVSGDFNGDRKKDIAAVAYMSDCTTNIYVWLHQNGSYVYKGIWWASKGYCANSVAGRVVAGDFTGPDADGKRRDDLAMMYDYGASGARIHVFTSDGSRFTYSKEDAGWWSAPDYSVSGVGHRFVAGDFNGDGKADVAAIYDYGNYQSAVHVWASLGTSFEYQGAHGWWQTTSATGGYSAPLVEGRVVAGKFNSDGCADIAALYDAGPYSMMSLWLNECGTNTNGNDNSYEFLYRQAWTGN